MYRTFVFFIGGSGARVLRSLVMLLASGIKLPENCKEIVPIVIDYDRDNADLARARNAVNSYRQIHQAAYGNGSLNGIEGFFSSRISPAITDGSIFISMAGDEMSFAEKISYSDMNDLTKSMLTTLYSDWRDSGSGNLVDMNELNLEIKKGFKGNPNVGSAIFNEVFDMPVMKDYLAQIREFDRVFIVGSLFGGTGSTGIPQIVKTIRSSDYPALRDSTTIGLNLIMPYFKLNSDTAKKANSTIDSNTFKSKTKAALHYYQSSINTDVQEIYYIGSDDTKMMDNNDGGEDQKNEAHIVDVLSASSIIEFASRPSREKIDRKNPPEQYVFASKETGSYTLDIFETTNESFRNNYLYNILAFGYFWKHYQTNIFPDSKGHIADNTKGLFSNPKEYYSYCFGEMTDSLSSFKNTLEGFLFMKDKKEFDYSYESWLRELDETGFRPFDLRGSDSYNNFRYIADKNNKSHTKTNLIRLYDNMVRDRKKANKDMNMPKQRIFIDLVSKACKELATEKNK